MKTKILVLLCLIASITATAQTSLTINGDSLTFRTDTYSKTYTQITMVEGAKSLNKFVFSGSNYTQTFYTSSVNVLSVNGATITPTFDNILTSIKNFASTHGAGSSSSGGSTSDATAALQTAGNTLLLSIKDSIVNGNLAIRNFESTSNVKTDSTNAKIQRLLDKQTTATFGTNTGSATAYTTNTNTINITDVIKIIITNEGTVAATIQEGSLTYNLEPKEQMVFESNYDSTTNKYTPTSSGVLVVNAAGTTVNVVRKVKQ